MARERRAPGCTGAAHSEPDGWRPVVYRGDHEIHPDRSAITWPHEHAGARPRGRGGRHSRNPPRCLNGTARSVRAGERHGPARSHYGPRIPLCFAPGGDTTGGGPAPPGPATAGGGRGPLPARRRRDGGVSVQARPHSRSRVCVVAAADSSALSPVYCTGIGDAVSHPSNNPTRGGGTSLHGGRPARQRRGILATGGDAGKCAVGPSRSDRASFEGANAPDTPAGFP